jgi:hypothetical protein
MIQNYNDETKQWQPCVSYHIRLPLNKLNLEVWITKQNIINLGNKKTKLGNTTTDIRSKLYCCDYSTKLRPL